MKKAKELKFKMEYSDNLIKIIGRDKETSEFEFDINFIADEEYLESIINKYYKSNKKKFYKEIIKTSLEMLENK